MERDIYKLLLETNAVYDVCCFIESLCKASVRCCLLLHIQRTDREVGSYKDEEEPFSVRRVDGLPLCLNSFVSNSLVARGKATISMDT